MRQNLLFIAAIAILATLARAEEGREDALISEPSYPITVSAKEVREVVNLSIDFANLKLSGEAITVVPISIESGVTGLVLIGNGTYEYKPEGGKNFTGGFRAAMLRFNPSDADAILKLSNAQPTVDRGAAEMAKHLLASTFRHCYHRGNDALVPPAGAIAADLYSNELGEILISSNGMTTIVYNFTTRAMLHEKK
jgi:hypothetical protein